MVAAAEKNVMTTFASVRREATPRFLLAVLVTLAAFAYADPANAYYGSRPMIVSGNAHTCALADDSSVKCWGANASGQLGNGTTVDSPTPTPVAGVVTAKQSGPPPAPVLSKIESLAAAANTTCALSEGTIWCWGRNTAGQLGLGTVDGDPHPTPQIIPGTKDFYGLTAGADHFCATTWQGEISCWGANEAGQIGTGTVGGNVPTPTKVAGLKKFKSIAAGGANTCVLPYTMKPICWGDGNAAQTEIATKDMHVLVASGASTCAFGWTENPVRCWPGAAAGAVANLDGLADVQTFGSTHNSFCAIAKTVTAATNKTYSDAKSLQCWGENANGQLGTGDTTPSPTPRLVGLKDVAELSTGAAATKQCAIVRGGDPYCWGAGVLVPTKVDGLSLVNKPQHPEWASIAPLTKLRLVKGGTAWQIKSKLSVMPSTLTFPEAACKGKVVGSAFFYKKVGKKAGMAGGYKLKKVGVRTTSKLRRVGDFCKASFTHTIPLSRFGDKKKRMMIGASSYGNKSMAAFETEFALKDLKKYFKKK